MLLIPRLTQGYAAQPRRLSRTKIVQPWQIHQRWQVEPRRSRSSDRCIRFWKEVCNVSLRNITVGWKTCHQGLSWASPQRMVSLHGHRINIAYIQYKVCSRQRWEEVRSLLLGIHRFSGVRLRLSWLVPSSVLTFLSKVHPKIFHASWCLDQNNLFVWSEDHQNKC